MKNIVLNFLFLSLFIAPVFIIPAHAEENDPTGLWLTENKRAAVEITKCDEGLCGNIAWIIKDGMKTDYKNPDPTKRDVPMCGLKILYGFTQNPKNLKVWEGGKIYKADEGDTYKATISVISANKLYLRGYVGIPLLGKTQYWTRVTKDGYPSCKK